MTVVSQACERIQRALTVQGKTIGLMTALQTITYSTGLRVGRGGAHQNAHSTVENRKGIRNLMLNNKLTVNTGQRADKTVRDQALEASLSAGEPT